MKKHNDTFDEGNNRQKIRRPEVWRYCICDRTITADQDMCNKCAALIVHKEHTNDRPTHQSQA